MGTDKHGSFLFVNRTEPEGTVSFLTEFYFRTQTPQINAETRIVNSRVSAFAECTHLGARAKRFAIFCECLRSP